MEFIKIQFAIEIRLARGQEAIFAPFYLRIFGD